LENCEDPGKLTFNSCNISIFFNSNAKDKIFYGFKINSIGKPKAGDPPLATHNYLLIQGGLG
jgi:hypothetical protein